MKTLKSLVFAAATVAALFGCAKEQDVVETQPRNAPLEVLAESVSWSPNVEITNQPILFSDGDGGLTPMTENYALAANSDNIKGPIVFENSAFPLARADLATTVFQKYTTVRMHDSGSNSQPHVSTTLLALSKNGRLMQGVPFLVTAESGDTLYVEPCTSIPSQLCVLGYNETLNSFEVETVDSISVYNTLSLGKFFTTTNFSREGSTDVCEREFFGADGYEQSHGDSVKISRILGYAPTSSDTHK